MDGFRKWIARSISNTGSVWAPRRFLRRPGRWWWMPIRAVRTEAMNSNFEELLAVFNANNVRYLIVGGHAVMLYTEPRYTKDLDIWVETGAGNAARVGRQELLRNKPGATDGEVELCFELVDEGPNNMDDPVSAQHL